MKKQQYIDFLESKIEIAPATGLDVAVPLVDFNDGTTLKPHQRDAIQWAVRGGRRALFESFGLGKTVQQLLACKIILENAPLDTGERGKALIVCPLGVRQEFTRDARDKPGIDVHYTRTREECLSLPPGSIMITNYERVRDGNINPRDFLVTCLD